MTLLCLEGIINNMYFNYKKMNKDKGAAMLVSVVFFLFISLAITTGLVSPTVREYKNSGVNLNSKKSYFLAESGSEDAVYRVLKNKTIETSETLTLGGNSTTTTITTTFGNGKQITSLGDVSTYQRKTNITLSTGSGVGFNYGIQSGTGGFNLSGGSTVNGNVYSNGNIQAETGVSITGTAVAAGASSYIGDSSNPYVGSVVIGSAGVGNAWAYQVLGASVAGNLYCQIGNTNNKSCNTSQGIPPAEPMPFTDDDITAWKNAATAGGIITGSTKCPGGYSGGNCIVGWQDATFGPGKITGNLTVNGGGTLTLTGPVWVVGTITLTGGGNIVLPSGYALNSETIVSDSTVSLGGGSSLGSGTSGSFLFVVSTSTSSSAITVSGGANTIAVVAQNGTVILNGGVSLSAAVGKTITASGGTTINYNSGLASPSFQSGPSGGWVLGTWGESQ
jgi:hypothetical protein